MVCGRVPAVFVALLIPLEQQMTSRTSTPRKFGKRVAPAVGQTSCPTLPLPAARKNWPLLHDEELWRAILTLQIHLDFTGARASIARYGGSAALLQPLHDAFARSRSEPVPLEMALGDTVHPIRLAYLLAAMDPSPDRRDVVLPLLMPTVSLLLKSGHVCDVHIASFLAFSAQFRYREDPVMRAALKAMDRHYGESVA
jgi:hypothetical protein